jgi:Ino eighty subunit 2
METINKLLKKQAPKTNRKGALAGDETPDGDANRPNPVFIRWTSNKQGSRVAVPEEIIGGPVGSIFGGPSTASSVRLGPSRLIQEVS